MPPRPHGSPPTAAVGRGEPAIVQRFGPLRRLLAWGRRARPLWWYPAWALVAGLVLGSASTAIDLTGAGPLGFAVYEGDPEAARSFVSLAATSVATITSLSLTITVVALQLASTQYSPRLIEHYQRDRGIRAVISLFLLTFAFAIAVLLGVRLPSPSSSGEVPGAAISVLVVLIVACLGALVFFVYRVTESIRVESILVRVRDRTIEAIRERDRRHDPADPPDLPEPDPDGLVVRSRDTGFFVDIDRTGLATCEAGSDLRCWILVTPGDFVAEGSPVALVVGDRAERFGEQVVTMLRFDAQRWIEADYSYGVRSLTDVAIKALSPGINDPTTACTAIQRISEVLAVAARTRADRTIELEGGGMVVVAVRSWLSVLHDVIRQLALYGRDDPQVVIAVIRLLVALAWDDSEIDRTDDLRTAADLLAELVDIDRPVSEREIIEREFEVLRHAFERRVTGEFRRNLVPTDRVDEVDDSDAG